jgi:antitoxin YefM
MGWLGVQTVAMQAVSCTQARRNLNAMIDKVVADRAPLTIRCRGGEGVVLISASEWALIEQVLHMPVHPNEQLNKPNR